MTLLFAPKRYESRSIQAVVRAPDTSFKLLYKWQNKMLMPVVVARGAGLDPVPAADLHQLQALVQRQVQKLDILKKPLQTNPLTALSQRPTSDESLLLNAKTNS